jgi:hypothetical protein
MPSAVEVGPLLASDDGGRVPMTALPDLRPMYTVAQVARRLMVDPDIVRGWCRSGTLRAVNVGRGSVKPRFRISPEALADFERKRAMGPPPPRPRRRRRRDPEVIEFF